MPRLFYPVDWENFAVYFARARRTSNLSAASIVKRLEDDGSVQRFELQSLVPLGHAGHTRLSKLEACDCGGLWLRTQSDWYQAGDFEIRYHSSPHRLRFELTLRVADGETQQTIEQYLAAHSHVRLSEPEKRAAESLALKLKPDDSVEHDKYRDNYTNKHGEFKVSKRGYDLRVWPAARWLAGLPSQGKPGPKKGRKKPKT